MNLKCHNCEYEWEYKGDKYFATCPRCLSKVKVPEVIKNGVETNS